MSDPTAKAELEVITVNLQEATKLILKASDSGSQAQANGLLLNVIAQALVCIAGQMERRTWG